MLLKPFFGTDEWCIVEDGFHPGENRFVESITSLGNGYMGLRGNFEEQYSGDSLKGTYIAGVYYPDRTVVGWWKVGYPEYFAKVLNAVNFIGIDIKLAGRVLDLHEWPPRQFRRVLDMQRGEFRRFVQVEDADGRVFSIAAKRFVSKDRRELACISYSISLEHDPTDRGAAVSLAPYLDGNVVNEDANYGEDFWLRVDEACGPDYQLVTMETKKSGFVVAAASSFRLYIDGQEASGLRPQYVVRSRFAGSEVELVLSAGQTVTLEKLVAVTTNRDYPDAEVSVRACELLQRYARSTYAELFEAHAHAWKQTWQDSDIVITGDPLAQQGIRFNIFHLHQTYTGEDPRLNIGPKGFTGEKYGGSTYWDTEAYCLPFYLGTREPAIARNLLLYRYNHLKKAKENARKLGLKGALYPMVTMNGEECHNEWEITFEEIHRNGAIAYAIFNYVRYTGDEQYLVDFGLEVLVEICRFWASRVTFQPRKNVYMILGVTGPNEYENNVNNNWYTNRIAAWCLDYTMEVLAGLRSQDPVQYSRLVARFGLDDAELEHWAEISAKMYYPFVPELGVFEQQDGFMDKELLTVKDIPPEQRPLNQNWSWDRILRSCFIKQADVLQGLFFLGHLYDRETKKRNFDFYEPMTVHESSLSPCVHTILAAELGYQEKAYELYLRTARLDLDNYNKDTDDGLHITSMAGTWMAIVYGFAGLRIENGLLSLRPFLPLQWESFAFRLVHRGHHLNVEVTSTEVIIRQAGGTTCKLAVFDEVHTVEASGELRVPLCN